METYGFITDLIGSYGFPVVCCIYMMVTNNKTIKENTAVTQKLCTLFEVFMEQAGCMNHSKDGEGNA